MWYKISICFCAVLLSIQYSIAQDGGEDQGISLSPGSIGGLQNSVSMYTGQVSFPMTLAALPGRGGLRAAVALRYSTSGLKQQVKTWNREDPTGYAGLGWSLDYPRITCNFKGTATRHDDDMFIIEGGESIQLVCTDFDTDGSNGYRTYQPAEHRLWEVKYFYNDEKWEVIRDDGTRHVFGDKSRPREDGTLQYMIAWGNWIGDSYEPEGQTEHVYGWNLSEIINLWGDRTTYTYSNIEEYSSPMVNGQPTASARHTRASALKRITGPTGNFIELNYSEKVYEPCSVSGDYRCEDKNREYQDPHVEKGEPDGYQEKYDERYLQSVEAYDELGLPLSTVTLEYGFIGKGEFYKRLLTGIQKVNYTGASLPKTVFGYFTGGDEVGYLNYVENSIGGKITYQYDVTRESEFSNRVITANAPEGFSNPQVFMGNDYAVVIWRTESGSDSKVMVYDWQGEWREYDLGSAGRVRWSGDIKNFEIKVALQKDFFTTVVRTGEDTYRVEIFNKDKKGGGWKALPQPQWAMLNDGRLASAQYFRELFVYAGPGYVAIGNLGTPKLYLYRWTGIAWEESIEQLSTPAGNTFGAAGNYIIAENTAIGPQDDFQIIYITEDGQLVKKTFNGDFDTDTMKSNREQKDRTYWHCAPALALVMADDNPEYVFELDEAYQSKRRKTLGARPDHYPVNWWTPEVFTINQYTEEKFDEGRGGLIARHKGNNEYSTVDFRAPWPNAPKMMKMVKAAGDVVAIGYGEGVIELDYYNASTDTWDKKLVNTERALDRYIQLAGSHTAMIAKDIYYLEPNGKWKDIGEISTENHNDGSWLYDLRTANDVVFSSLPYNETEINSIINGRVEKHILPFNLDKRSGDSPIGKMLIGNDMFAAFPAGDVEKWSNNKLYFFKYSDEKYEDGHKPLVVSNVNVDDGHMSISKTYVYSYVRARMDKSGRYPLFNEVKVISASSDQQKTPRGYMQYYFYNGKPLAELADVPGEQLSYERARQLTGLVYRVETYDSKSKLISDTETIYSVYSNPVVNSKEQSIAMVYYTRPVKAKSSRYLNSGVMTDITETSYNSYGLPAIVENYRNDRGLYTTEYFTYYPEKYEGSGHHIISEIIATSKSILNRKVAATATVWQDVQEVPQAIKTYNWLGYGSSTFNSWSGDTPEVQWRLNTWIKKRDNKGNVLVSEDFMGDYEAAVFDELKVNPIASASYATDEQIAATSFEDRQMGSVVATGVTDEEAYTGVKSIKGGTATLQQLPVGKYILYYWYKENSGTVTVNGGVATDQGDQFEAKGWFLRKWTLDITSPSKVIISSSGFVDEVRIYPEGAYMSTFVYDEKQQKTAETGSNMLTTFYYYDDLNRQHYITDHDGNIISYYEYGFRNLEE